jgi:methionyl aminopeptidase
MALIKTPDDIKVLRKGGAVLDQVLAFGESISLPGTALIDIDRQIHEKILEANCTPSFLGYEGFPNASCLSLNAEVVHGIPDERILQEGDILGIDVGLWYENRCVDGARTVAVVAVSPEATRLLTMTQKALAAGIAAAKPFRRVGAISQAIQDFAEKNNLGIVRALTGHGVGHRVHEDPEVPNFGRVSDGILLRPGMVLAIEPMLTLGSGDVYTEVDGWTVTTADKSLSAQFEHTILITPRGAEVLTRST